ncbi:hypothetical protein NHX12_004238 [Muraenolepis orangiensis]|uniref:Uncharacterized protein n=1 Tax=Muraenolepis orangiensis TaxID=630683 RepID=A0A9Q0DWN5_9TELE|nr:hypothetical protein NHX12_004238 [Muraenolepis orangiensis]
MTTAGATTLEQRGRTTTSPIATERPTSAPPLSTVTSSRPAVGPSQLTTAGTPPTTSQKTAPTAQQEMTSSPRRTSGVHLLPVEVAVDSTISPAAEKPACVVVEHLSHTHTHTKALYPGALGHEAPLPTQGPVSGPSRGPGTHGPRDKGSSTRAPCRCFIPLRRDGTTYLAGDPVQLTPDTQGPHAAAGPPGAQKRRADKTQVWCGSTVVHSPIGP